MSNPTEDARIRVARSIYTDARGLDYTRASSEERLYMLGRLEGALDMLLSYVDGDPAGDIRDHF